MLRQPLLMAEPAAMNNEVPLHRMQLHNCVCVAPWCLHRHVYIVIRRVGLESQVGVNSVSYVTPYVIN